MNTKHAVRAAAVGASALVAAAATAETCGSETLGSLSGPVRTASFVGDTGYLVTPGEFVTLDLSDPDSLVVLDVDSTLPAFDSPFNKGLAFDGDRAYVGDLGAIATFDLSNPSDPELLAVVDRPVSPLAAGDGFVYAGRWEPENPSRLDVLNVDDPAAPASVGAVSLPGSLRDLTYNDGFVYTALNDAGVGVIDVGEPSAPVLRGVVDVSDAALELSRFGNYLYTSTSESGVKVIDVTDPDAPTIVGTIPGIGSFERIATSGDRLYLSRARATRIFDLAAPQAPAFVGEASLGNLVLALGFFDDLALVISGTSPRVSLVDLSDPQTPVARSAITFPRFLSSITRAGDTLYGVAALGAGAPILAIDVSDPESPRPLDAIDEIAGEEVFSRALEIDGDVLVTISSGELTTIDAADPADLRVLDQFQLPSSGGFALQDGLAAVASDELRVFDLADPGKITPLGATGTLNCRDVALSGEIAYVATASGFATVDIADLFDPIVTGQVALPGGLELIEARGATAVATSDFDTLWVIDASDPASPAAAGSLSLSEEPTGFSVVGDRVFVAFGSDAVQVVDISEPALPTVIETINPMHGDIDDVLVRNGLAFLATDTGLRILDPRGCFPRADLTGDGLVTAADLASLIAAWGQSDSAADLDADGVVGESDLAILIAAWS